MGKSKLRYKPFPPFDDSKYSAVNQFDATDVAGVDDVVDPVAAAEIVS
jgi:hypothetical protein